MVKTRSGRGKTPERRLEDAGAPTPPPPASARKPRRKNTAPTEPEIEQQQQDVQGQGASKPFSPTKETNVISSPRGRTPAPTPAPAATEAEAARPQSPERMPASARRQRSTISERSTSRSRSTDEAARTPLPNDDEPPSKAPHTEQSPHAPTREQHAPAYEHKQRLHERQRWQPQQQAARVRYRFNTLVWLTVLSLVSVLALGLAAIAAVVLQPARRAALLEGGTVAVVDGFLADVQRWDCAAAKRMVQGHPFAPLAARSGLVEAKCHNLRSFTSKALLRIRPSLQRSSAYMVATIKRIVEALHEIGKRSAANKRALESSKSQETDVDAPGSFQAVLPAQAFAEALAPCSKQTLADMLDPASMPANKMLSVAVACSHAAECTAALNTIRSGAAALQRVMHVDGKSYGGPAQAGALQSSLASFLSAYPNGLLIFQHLESMSRECLIVVNNILSENGSLQAEGRAVPTTRGLAVVLSQLPGSAALPPCNSELENKVKRQLQRAAASKEGLEIQESSLAKALRRRIDFAVSAAEVAA